MMTTMEQFAVINSEMLAGVEGGGWAKCVLGTAGSAGLGFLAGAGAGTFTIPIIGTVSGGAIGGWSGAAAGYASYC